MSTEESILENIFSGEEQNKAMADLMRELVNKVNWELKTELSRDEIKEITVAVYNDYVLKKRLNITLNTKLLIKEYCIYMISHKRKSRNEIIEVFKGWFVFMRGGAKSKLMGSG